MPDEIKPKRKLTAILSADVKGYSLLMADDEVATIKTLREYRNIMSACIEDRSGRVVDAVGDNLLAEFVSAVEAVQCAVEIQEILKDRNQKLPDDKKMEFRIGVNIGDVIQDGERIFGDGVNVAARIEGLADSGGNSDPVSNLFRSKKPGGAASDMMELYKKNTTPIASKAKQENPDLIKRGVLHEVEAPEYCNKYDKVIASAMKGK